MKKLILPVYIIAFCYVGNITPAEAQKRQPPKETTGVQVSEPTTTFGEFKNDIHVLNAKINELSDSSIKPSDEGSFQLVVFKQK